MSVTIERADRRGIIGRNGTGKTTLLNVIAGRLQPTWGNVSMFSGLWFTLLDQNRGFGAATTVWEAAALPFAPLRALEAALTRQADDIASAGAAYGRKHWRDTTRISSGSSATVDTPTPPMSTLDGVGFDPARARSVRVEWW